MCFHNFGQYATVRIAPTPNRNSGCRWTKNKQQQSSGLGHFLAMVEHGPCLNVNLSWPACINVQYYEWMSGHEGVNCLLGRNCWVEMVMSGRNRGCPLLSKLAEKWENSKHDQSLCSYLIYRKNIFCHTLDMWTSQCLVEIQKPRLAFLLGHQGLLVKKKCSHVVQQNHLWSGKKESCLKFTIHMDNSHTINQM